MSSLRDSPDLNFPNKIRRQDRQIDIETDRMTAGDVERLAASMTGMFKVLCKSGHLSRYAVLFLQWRANKSVPQSKGLRCEKVRERCLTSK